MNKPADIGTPSSTSQLIALYQSGRYAELEQFAQQALNQDPESGFLWKALGVALQLQGKDALQALQNASRLLPDDAEACSNLGNALRDLGRLEEAATHYRHALALRPDSAETFANLGNVLRDLGQLNAAHASLRQALQINPAYAEAHYNLGIILFELNHLGDAESAYRTAIALMPDFAQAHSNLGLLLRQEGKFDDAARSFQKALEIQPDFADALYNLGNVCNDLGQLDAAATQYKRALSVQPRHADALNNLGNVLKDAGRLEEASHAYDAAIAIKPDFIVAHYSLSQLKTYRSDDPHRAMLEQQRVNAETLPAQERIQFCFTLGKVYEDIGLYDESFSAYKEGNRLKYSPLTWDEKAEEDVFARTMATFSKEYFATHSHSGYADKTPIFVVGMPRSGTSLIEQILSTYPGVVGAGELSDLSDVITCAMPDASFALFPEAASGLSSETLAAMARQYVERIRRHASQAAYVIDKMPANFFYVGMIRQMLPHAKIIHAMRDPMDSCFSCYARLFVDDNLPFAYDLEALGRYYRRYITLMRHWYKVLPADAILDLHYEEMVADTEGQARRLLTHLGLPWDANCLDFYRNKRQVRTASIAQVRQPIYRTSLARWERYAHHLAPLYELVKDYRDR